jgi:hypothetical protein
MDPKEPDPEHWYIYIILQRQQVLKKSQNIRNQGFPCYFCLMMEGSGAGSVLVNIGSGYGSRRPKNIRIQMRIRDTGLYAVVKHLNSYSACTS